jgi:E3 ubiquitin-protein ligase TRIP12
VFPFTSLSIFHSSEINHLFSGDDEPKYWSLSQLSQNIIPNYGFTQKSEVFLNFVKILSELAEEERKQFLMFVTGSGKLPIGGKFLKNYFAALDF